MDPNDRDVYAGIAGAKLAVDEFEFGHGITLKRSYAHVMAPYLAAFAPAEPGEPHPAPWKVVGGGIGFDVYAELHIPVEFSIPAWFDRVNTVWWFAALVRLRATPLLSIPVIADSSFAEIPTAEGETHFWPVEMNPTRLVPVENPASTIEEGDLNWIREHWLSAGGLMHRNDDFNLAFQAADQCIWSSSPSLALVSLWGALERLFSPAAYELRFRVSANIASYLEPPGEERRACYRRIKKLYDARSKAAHGSRVEEAAPLLESYALLKRVLTRMIEDDHVPTREDLEAILFGGEL
jgi:hypothetical protein